MPARLYKAWEEYEHRITPALDMNASPKCRNEVELTVPELRNIFDPVVEQIIGFIAGALSKTEVKGKVKVIMVVGGFAASQYLMKRLREGFTVQGTRVTVVSLPDPGSLVCQGAAILGTRLGHTIVSRVMRKTYSVEMTSICERGSVSLRFY